MNALDLQEFAAEAVAMNRMFSESSAMNEDQNDDFVNNIKPRVFGLSPPSKSGLARRRAATSAKQLSSNSQSKEEGENGI